MKRINCSALGFIGAVLLLLGLFQLQLVFVSAFSPSRSTTGTRTTRLPSSDLLITSRTSPLHLFNFFGEEKEKESPKPEATEPEEDLDPVEKLFSFFFGKPEEEPFGLKRFGKERFPEQYPATIDDFDVEPLPSDNRDMAALRPLLKNTNLEARALQLTYDANRDGWNAAKFHQAVDRKGGGLVVCTTRLGMVAGGYNPKGWVGYGEARGSIAAFLFKKNLDGSYVKLRKVGGPGLAQM